MAARSAVHRGATKPMYVVTEVTRQRIAPGPVYLNEASIPDPPPPGGGAKNSKLSLSIGIGL